MNQIALWLRLWIIVAIAAPAARLAAQDADTPLTPEQAQEMFAATFGTEVERIAASPTKTDDVEFAKQMLIVARGGKQRAELINVMLEHARRFGSATPDGYETAIEAMRLLIERDPSRAGDLYAEIVTLRQRQYSATRGEERVEIGKAWLDDQLAAAEAKARDNDWAEAQAMYRQAMTVATRADPTRKPDIQAAIDAMRDHMLVEAKSARLKANIKSAQEASNTALIKTTTDQLMKLYVVDLDTPNEARKYTFLSDDAELKANVPLACKDPADLDEEQAEQLAKWYHDLSRSATGKGKLATLERARGYYERYVELHGTDASVRERAEVLREIAADDGGGDFSWSTDVAEREALWHARHHALYRRLQGQDHLDADAQEHRWRARTPRRRERRANADDRVAHRLEKGP